MANSVDSNSYGCKQENCPLKESGECLEGITNIEECPHSFLLSNQTEEAIQENSENGMHLERELLYSGDAIAEVDLNKITYKYQANLVLLMGEPDSGKTTLIASLFDQFQQGPFADHYFAGSRTQLGFEKRCFLARWIGSGRDEPDTERTKTKEVHYLHLSMRDQKLNDPIKHLLFADVSGEQFKRIRDRKDEMDQFEIFRRTDHIFCLVDGALLMDEVERHAIKNNLFMLLQRVVESEVYDKKPLNIIITKYDKWSEHSDSIVDFFENPLKKKYGQYIGDVFYVASRSISDNIKEGTGLDRIFNKILDPPNKDSKGSILNPNYKKPIREFQKYIS